jgi:hypothetical protein
MEALQSRIALNLGIDGRAGVPNGQCAATLSWRSSIADGLILLRGKSAEQTQPGYTKMSPRVIGKPEWRGYLQGYYYSSFCRVNHLA